MYAYVCLHLWLLKLGTCHMPPILACWPYGRLIEDMFAASTSRTFYHFSIFSTLQSPFSKGNYMVLEGKYCSDASNKAELHACKKLNCFRNGLSSWTVWILISTFKSKHGLHCFITYRCKKVNITSI